jgi:hypothetical protein
MLTKSPENRYQHLDEFLGDVLTNISFQWYNILRRFLVKHYLVLLSLICLSILGVFNFQKLDLLFNQKPSTMEKPTTANGGDAKDQKNRQTQMSDSSAKRPQSALVSVVQGAGNSIYDFQTNGGDERHLWVLPDGTVHAVYVGSKNREAPHQNRRSYYAYSSDYGESFINLGNVENQTSEYPSMDITSDGRAIIASNAINPRATRLYMNASAGSGKFKKVEFVSDPHQCIAPRLAVPSDSLYVFFGFSRIKDQENTWNTFNPYTKKFGFSGIWGPKNQILVPGVYEEAQNTIARSEGGKVSMVIINHFNDRGDYGENNIIICESLDGGNSFGDPIIVTNNPADMTQPLPGIGKGISALYLDEELHIVWTQYLDHPEPDWWFDDTELKIKHWSPNVNGGLPTTAVAWDSVNFAINDPDGEEGAIKEGMQHFPLGRPHIGADENGNLTIVFTGFSGDATSNEDPVTGYAFGDIWAVASRDLGETWHGPINLTNSPDMDDRYPYISTWNEADKINILYQSDTRAGSIADGGAEFIGQVDHFFFKTDIFAKIDSTRQARLAKFALYSNYPNPFNYETQIRYDVPILTRVKINIYNALGQHINNLVNSSQSPGHYDIVWNGADEAGRQMGTGLYFCRMEGKGFLETIKLALVK